MEIAALHLTKEIKARISTGQKWLRKKCTPGNWIRASEDSMYLNLTHTSLQELISRIER